MIAQQQQWFFSTGGERFGPVGFDYLLELAKSGRLDPRNDLVWSTTLSDWEPAGEVEGLFERRAVKAGDGAGESAAGFASTGTFESTPIPRAHFPGTGRIGYLMGTLVVPVTNPDTSFATQLIGIVSVGAFVFLVSLVIWGILKATVGIRLADEAADDGIDQAELGMEAYPEFGPSMAN